jgi:hypothetical protein
MAKKRKKRSKAKYWIDKPLFYSTKFLIAVYIISMIFSWSVLFALPANCEMVNQTNFFMENSDSYSVQSCTNIMGNAIRVIYFR